MRKVAALLLEDLRSPCSEEVAVFHAFSRIVNEARRGIVILDTAPTGHTLLLLDAAGSYHREILRTSSVPAERIVTPLMRLEDPGYTKILLVTLAEPTPVQEAAQLQSDLRRAGIEPFAWVINQSLAAAPVTDPLLRARAAAERPLIDRVRRTLAARTAIVPMLDAPPVGPDALRAVIRALPTENDVGSHRGAEHPGPAATLVRLRRSSLFADQPRPSRSRGAGINNEATGDLSHVGHGFLDAASSARTIAWSPRLRAVSIGSAP